MAESASAPTASDAVERLAAVRETVARAARDSGRDPAEVTLMAVSKTFPAEAIEPVLAAGHRVFGENYVQEAKAKWPTLRERYPGVEIHLIGPLQSNKAKEAVALFDAIHSRGRPSLSDALAKEIAPQNRRPRLLVQVNTGEEPQKGGVLPRETDAFLEACRERWGLTIDGLMAIPPADVASVPFFAEMRALLDRHRSAMFEPAAPWLSLGMSDDFEEAIAHGATHVRIGTRLFGARPPRQPV